MIPRVAFTTFFMLLPASCSSMSCGSDDPRLPVFYTKYTQVLQIPVYDDLGRPINQIDQVAMKVADHFSNAFPRITRSRLQNLLEQDPPLVVTMPEPFPCAGHNDSLGCHYFSGELRMNVIEVFWREDICIAHTSMAHEFIHYFDRMARGRRDPEHNHPLLWHGPGTVLNQSNNELARELCE